MNYKRYTCEKCLRIFDGDFKTRLCPGCSGPSKH